MQTPQGWEIQNFVSRLKALQFFQLIKMQYQSMSYMYCGSIADLKWLWYELDATTDKIKSAYQPSGLSGWS